jgi:hypothetical protein
MELLPGVAPAASEPKFTESSSILPDVVLPSNPSCRKSPSVHKSAPYLRKNRSAARNGFRVLHTRRFYQKVVCAYAVNERIEEVDEVVIEARLLD